MDSTQLKWLGIGVCAGIVSTLALARLLKIKSKQESNQVNINYQSTEYQLLKQQQLARTIQYFGKDKFTKLQASFVTVFGVGGVGSHAVNMLARSGVRRIRIIDFDQVSLSSLNRHAFAVRSDVGISKVKCIKKYISNIFPHIQIEAIEEYATKDNIDRLLPLDCDYIIDCIDNIDAKAELVAKCIKNNLKIIISGGAGLKNDPTKLQIRDFSECRYDELITALRRRLTKLGIKKGAKVVYSYQQAEKEMLPLNQEQSKDPNSFKVFDNYRIRIIPVMGTMPAIIGMSIASYVLCDLAEQAYEPYMLEEVKSVNYAKLHNRLISDEKKMGVEADDVQFDLEDIYVIMRHIFGWKCFITGKQNVKHFYIARWDPTKKADIYNMVPMCKEVYDKHITYKSKNEFPYTQQILLELKQKWECLSKLKKSKLKIYK